VAVRAAKEVGRSFYESRGFDTDGRRTTERAGREIEELVPVGSL